MESKHRQDLFSKQSPIATHRGLQSSIFSCVTAYCVQEKFEKVEFGKYYGNEACLTSYQNVLQFLLSFVRQNYHPASAL